MHETVPATLRVVDEQAQDARKFSVGKLKGMVFRTRHERDEKAVVDPIASDWGFVKWTTPFFNVVHSLTVHPKLRSIPCGFAPEYCPVLVMWRDFNFDHPAVVAAVLVGGIELESCCGAVLVTGFTQQGQDEISKGVAAKNDVISKRIPEPLREH
jgi:hypothetical protein